MIKTILKSPHSQYNFLFFFPITVFWLTFYALGFPPPMYDDAFFIGAAINLAKTGNFFNPLLSIWSERTIDRFYVQPPFHSYVLAAWLKIFGINTHSLLAFQALCCLIVSIFIALILKKYKFPPLAPLLITLCFGLFIFGLGLRQDALSMAFLAVGFWCLTQGKFGTDIIGFTCLGSSILSSPVNIALTTPIGILIVVSQILPLKDLEDKKKLFLKKLAALLIAILLTFSLFSFSIHFKYSQFFDDFFWHISLRRQPLSGLIPSIIFQVRVGAGEIIYGSLYLLLLYLDFLVIRNFKKQTTMLKTIAILLNVVLFFNIVSYSNTLSTNCNLLCWVTIILIISKLVLDSLHKKVLWIILTIVVLINHSTTLITLFFQDRTVAESVKTTQAFVQNNPQYRYVVDSVVSRFVFDYNLPDNAVSWEFSNNPSIFYPTEVKMQNPDMVWLISKQRAWFIPDELPDYPRVNVLGREFKSIARQPYDVLIVK